MTIKRIALLACLVLSLCACSNDPTALEIPKGALSVRQFALLGGSAYQTDFTLEAPYPSTPALEFYRKRVGDPWVLCEWSGTEWSHFVDAQGAEPRSVHQQLYMWVNPGEKRTLMLSMRYYSAKDAESVPDNAQQHIVLVEYFRTDVSESIKRLNLKCPNLLAAL